MLRPPVGRPGLLGGRRDAVTRQQVVDERAVLLGQQLPRLFGVDPALLGADVFGRQQQVDAVGLAAGLLLDPGQLVLQALGAVRDRAENPEAAGIGHRRHHVAAVTEGTDRKLNAEHFGDPGSHCPTLRVTD